MKMSHFLLPQSLPCSLTEPAHWVSLDQLVNKSRRSGMCDHNCLLHGLGGLGSKLGSSSLLSKCPELSPQS